MVRSARSTVGPRSRSHRGAVLAVTALGALGLAACGSSSTTSPTTVPAPASGGSPPTTAAVIGGASAGLCADIAAFSKQEQGLLTAEQAAGGSAGSLASLRSYAARAKPDFDRTASRITDGLASAPPFVQSAWVALQPQVDQLFTAATSATSLPAFVRAAGSIASTNGFITANQTLSTFAQGACPTGAKG